MKTFIVVRFIIQDADTMEDAIKAGNEALGESWRPLYIAHDLDAARVGLEACLIGMKEIESPGEALESESSE